MRKDYEIHETLQDIWCIRYRQRKTCAYLLKTAPGAILIDSGPDEDAAGIMTALQTARVGLSSIRALVITHWHSNQTAGIHTLINRSKCPLFYAKVHESYILSRSQGRNCTNNVKTKPTDEPPAVTRNISSGMEISSKLTVVQTPDHANDRVILISSATNALFADDLSMLNKQLSPSWILPRTGTPFQSGG